MENPVTGEAVIADSRFSRKAIVWLALLLMLIAGFAAVSYAGSQAKFSIGKKLCHGTPSSMTSPQSCAHEQFAAQNSPVFYVISVTNPWGMPAQAVDIIDDLPNSFAQSGAAYCRDSAGNAVSISPSSSPNSVGVINLPIGETVHCFIAGQFTSTGGKDNTAKGINGDGYKLDSEKIETDVKPKAGLPQDLSITKTSNVASVDLTTGATQLTYTITIKNNGPGDVDVGDWFKLHDRLSLLPNSVPLNVSFVSANCVADPGSDCLDPNEINLAGSQPVFVGTMGQTPFFTWDFNGGNGMIQQGDSLTLSITVEIESLGKALDCVIDKNANGLRNTAFFTLTDDGTILVDPNAANNTATQDISANVAYSEIDPNCGKGHLKVTKTQVNPVAGSAVGWGQQVIYEIRIKNQSYPAQTITIKKPDLEDWVTEGINTPPFNRQYMWTKCIFSTNSGLCNNFNSAGNQGINAMPPFNYSYYGHTDKAWESDQDIKLAHGEEVVFHTAFVYDKPDCETVPETPKRPIINTVRARYKATPYGDPNGDEIWFTQAADAETLMKKQPPCKFKVTKRYGAVKPPLNSAGQHQLQFGQSFDYEVTYTNNGNPRTVGTLMDAVRINIPGYANSLPFSSSWKCSASAGVTGIANFNGSISNGQAQHIGSPVMGSPAAVTNIGSNIFFPTGGTVTCNVTVEVTRPATDDPYCTTQDAYFENYAMMDVTSPFNTNTFWPSAFYNNASISNPTPQLREWAAIKTLLPKCWDAQVNKTATVNGLPAGSQPWSYPGGPAVNWKVTTTNLAQSPLGKSPSAPGWSITDTLTLPYGPANKTFVNVGCTTGTSWCWAGGVDYPIPLHKIGIRNIAPNSSGDWNLQTPGIFLQNGQDITNCATLKAENTEAGPFWYNRSNNPTKLTGCKTVPIIPVTKIAVRKQVVDLTGANVLAIGNALDPFKFSVSCTPFGIPINSVTSFGLITNATGFSNTHVVNNVPVINNYTGAFCKVEEIAMPAIPAAIAQRCGGQGNVEVITNAPVVLTSLNPTNNQVTVTNTYRCKGGSGGPTLIVGKRIMNPEVPNGGGPFPAPLNFSVTANCTPPTSPATQMVSAGVSTGTVTFPVTMGATCTVTENTSTATFPQNVINFCATMGKVPAWKTPVINPNGGSVTINSQTTQVVIRNEWHCVGQPASTLTVTKRISSPAGPMPSPALTNLNFGVTTNCTPASTPASGTINNGTGFGSVNFSVPTGANCTVTETTMPAFPANAVQFCAAQGGTPQWGTPIYNGTPSTTGIPVSISGPNNSVSIINPWSCVANPPATGQLEIIKSFTTTPLPFQWPASNWLINVNCTPAASASSVTINTSASGNATITGSAMVTGPVGANCTINEPTSSLPAFPSWITAYCNNQGGKVPTWNAPTYSPSNSVSITPGVKTVTVGNSWSCTGGQTGGNAIIHLVKGLQGPPAVPGAPPPPAITVPFTFTSNCSIPSTPTSLTFNGGGGGIFTVPLGSTCNIMEAMPPLPAAATQYCAMFGGQIAMWDTPTWSIPQPMTVNQNGMIVAITNKWKCAPPPPSIVIPGDDSADQPEKKKKKKLKLPKIRIDVGIPIPGRRGDGGNGDGGDGNRSDDTPPKP